VRRTAPLVALRLRLAGSASARRSAALLLAPLLLLPACGGDGAGDGPQVAGKAGEKPTVTAPEGKPDTDLDVQVLDEGDGPEVQKGDLLVAHYLGQTWRENKVFDNSWDRGVPAGFPIGIGSVIPGWDEGLVGKKVGSRVLLVIPPAKGYGEQGQPAADIKGDDTLVFVVDIRGSHAAKAGAEGKQVSTGGDALPMVAGGAGKPKITIPKGGKPPAKLVNQTVIEGTGAPVEKEQLLVVQYVGVTWRDGKQFDASWDRGQPAPFPIGMGQVIQGWDRGLIGSKVGSRVLLVIPPDQGYGEEGQPQAGIKGDDTLVFAVDILGAYG
jgi:peptidylprolyl isomerase